MASLPFITTILILLALPFLGQNAAGKLITSETDAYIRSLIERWDSTGLSLALVRKDPSAPNGWYHEFGSYGIANARGDPVTPDTMFAIASNSKLFLSISVGLLIDNTTLREERRKELEWTTKAKDVYGDLWGLWDEEMSRGVTLQDMVSHRTGIPRHDLAGAPSEGGVTGMPLNMSSSTYSVAEAEESGNLADGFQYHLRDLTRGINGTKRATVPYWSRPGEEKVWAGAGGVLTSARDLAMWVSMLLGNGKHPYNNEQVIPSHVIEHVAMGVTVAQGKALFPELSPKVYGAGQMRFSYRGREVIEHGGNNPGYRTQVSRLPNDNLGIVVLSNDAQGNGLMEAVKWRIIDDILFKSREPIDWNRRFEGVWVNNTRDFQLLTPRPSQPNPPSSPMELMAQGTYSHSAYGSFRPCLVPSSLSFHGFDASQYDQTAECSTLLKSLAAQRIMKASNMTIPTFIASSSRLLMTHFRIQHFDTNLFNVSAIWSNAEVRQKEGLSTAHGSPNAMENREDQAALHVSIPGPSAEDDGDMLIGLDEHFELEWVIAEDEEGLAFKGDFWGMEGRDAKSPGGKGKESAEVWFARTL